jgi:hypothetical protein
MEDYHQTQHQPLRQQRQMPEGRHDTDDNNTSSKELRYHHHDHHHHHDRRISFYRWFLRKSMQHLVGGTLLACAVIPLLFCLETNDLFKVSTSSCLPTVWPVLFLLTISLDIKSHVMTNETNSLSHPYDKGSDRDQIQDIVVAPCGMGD